MSCRKDKDCIPEWALGKRADRGIPLHQSAASPFRRSTFVVFCFSRSDVQGSAAVGRRTLLSANAYWELVKPDPAVAPFDHTLAGG